jgi:hypothetical protein
MKSLEAVRIRPSRYRSCGFQSRSYTNQCRNRLRVSTSSTRSFHRRYQYDGHGGTFKPSIGVYISPLSQCTIRLAHRETRPNKQRTGSKFGASREDRAAATATEPQIDLDEEEVSWLDNPDQATIPDPMDEDMLHFEEELVLRKAKKQKPTPFVPETFTPETLITNRIATASATKPGSQATIQAALARLSRRDDTSFSFDSDLARQVAHGDVVRFKDADEKARILALAEEHAMDTTAKRNRDKVRKLKEGEEISWETPLPIQFENVPDKNRKEIVDKVLRGKYHFEGRAKREEKESSFSDLKKSLDLNGTYDRPSGSGFMDMFKRLFPQTSKR